MSTEESLISALLLDNEKIDDVADLVTSEDFSSAELATYFRGASTLRDSKQPVDIFTLADWLEKNTAYKKAVSRLGEIMRTCGTPANCEHYAKAIKAKSTERKLLNAAKEIINIVTGQGDTKDKLEAAQEAFSAVNFQTGNSGPTHIKNVLQSSLEALDERFNRKGEIVGLSTGFKNLDEHTAGLQKSDLIYLAARPSMGKTTLAMNIVENVAISGKTALVFSLEMSGQQLCARAMSSVGAVPFQLIRSGKLSDDHEWSKVTAAFSRLINTSVFIDATPAISIHELKARARKQHRRTPLDLIVIDYLQLVTSDGDNRNLQISTISAGLKALAKELDVPVLCLSQLNRNLEQRPNKRPVMSDLRDSGSIEQDADVIAFVYRDEVYNSDSPDKGLAEIIFGKQRNGPIGTINLEFQGQFCRFRDFEGQLPSKLQAASSPPAPLRVIGRQGFE